jgi:hypothetical protein
MLKKLFRVYSIDNKSLFLIIVGSLSWCLTMVKSGIKYPFGIGYWGPNGHDGVWHLALINSLVKKTWQIPVFAGEQIKNYHIGFDLFLAILHKISGIPTTLLYFQVLPVVFALLIGALIYRFMMIWQKSKIVAFWTLFFIYFGGSFGFVYTLYNTGQIGGESLFWSQQAISTLINPPFALSLVLLFSGLIFLYSGIERNNRNLLVLSTFSFGLLIQIKIYAGLLILAGLFVSGFVEFLRNRKVTVLKVFIGTLTISVLLFSNLSGSNNIIIFKPLWFMESLFGSVDRFYWPRFAGALLNYKLGHVWLKMFPAYFLALIIFIVGNFGSRLISFLWVFKKGIKLSNYQYNDILIVTIIISGIVIPTFFVQSGTPWNTIQFMYYSLIFSGLLSGIFFGKFIESNNDSFFKSFIVKKLLIVIVLIFTLPTTIGTLLYNYLPGRPPAMISNSEIEALNFLKTQTDGIVLTQPFNIAAANLAVSNPPRPLYLYESTAYVSAYSDKITYFEDKVNLDITGYDWQIRQHEADRFFNDPTYDGKYELINKKKIKYIYVVKVLESSKDLHITDDKIFENSDIKIYKVY